MNIGVTIIDVQLLGWIHEREVVSVFSRLFQA